MTANLDFVKTDCEDMSCHTGTTFNLDLISTGECKDTPYDLSGYTASMLIFDTIETVVIDTIVGTFPDRARGLVNFNIPAIDTHDYVVGMYNYHIELSISTSVYRVAEGYFEVTQ
jgi:hypothetical protein